MRERTDERMTEPESLLQRFLDGELGPEEASAFEASLESDPELLAFVREARAVGGALREGYEASADGVDFSAMWQGIEKDIAWHDAGLERARAARAEQVGIAEGDVSWRDSFRRLLGWKLFTGAVLAAAALLLVPRVLMPPPADPTVGDGTVGHVEVVAAVQAPRFEGVEVDSVEASDQATVMVFQGGEGGATFIWVSETQPASEEKAI